MKIKTDFNDYTWDGMGFNNFNFVRNTVSKITDFLLKTYVRCDYMKEDELNTIADKLRRIIEIINE